MEYRHCHVNHQNRGHVEGYLGNPSIRTEFSFHLWGCGIIWKGIGIVEEGKTRIRDILCGCEVERLYLHIEFTRNFSLSTEFFKHFVRFYGEFKVWQNVRERKSSRIFFKWYGWCSRKFVPSNLWYPAAWLIFSSKTKKIKRFILKYIFNK